MITRELEETARRWDNDPWQTGELAFWSQLASVQRRLALKESGQPGGNWIDYTLETYFGDYLPLNRCLSLGCGRGRVEREWAKRQAFLACDANDISPVSIADATKQAVIADLTNINYKVADIDHIALPDHSYDAAWAVSSAHHFTDLEHIFGQVAHSLKQGGLFILHEYVGARRFQFDERQRKVIESCLTLLSQRYRMLPTPAQAENLAPYAQSQGRDIGWIVSRIVDKLREGAFFSTASRQWRRRKAAQAGQRAIKETAVPTLRSVISVDPSEAVRSAEVVPILETSSDTVEQRPLGGTILRFLLADIAGNFQDEVGEQLLEVVFQLEDILIDCDDLPSDFTYIVARPKSNVYSAQASLVK